MTGYLASVEYTLPSGEKQLYSPVGIAWLDKQRSISACFASVARRMRSQNPRAIRPVHAEMQVISLQGKIVFKHNVDLRPV